METRLARREDLLGLLQLYRHLHPDGWLEEGDQALQVWERIWETPGYRIVVGEEGGELVSSCTVVIVPNLTHGGRPYALVENVVTRPDCRNLTGHTCSYRGTPATSISTFIILKTGAKPCITGRKSRQYFSFSAEDSSRAAETRNTISRGTGN